MPTPRVRTPALSSGRLRAYVDGTRSDVVFDSATRSLIDDLGVQGVDLDRRLTRAMAACTLGALPEEVSNLLDWKDFERFCATLFRAQGYSVTENLLMRNPRAQIDLLARSPSIALVVDCKHWSREKGPSAMGKVAMAQAERSKVVRKKMKDVEPMAVVVLVLSNEQTRLVNGAAVVPIRALSAFLQELPALKEMLALY